MHKLHVLVMLTAGFIIVATACKKENSIYDEAAALKALKTSLDSIGIDTLYPPGDTLPHDSFPHDTFPYPPHDTFPRPPHDTFPWPPHDTFPWPDTTGRRHS